MKRASDRKRISIRCRARIESSDGISLTGQTMDLSKSGAFVATTDTHGMSDCVTLHIELDQLDSLRIDAHIVRKTCPETFTHTGIALCFRSLDVTSRVTLDALLSRFEPATISTYTHEFATNPIDSDLDPIHTDAYLLHAVSYTETKAHLEIGLAVEALSWW